MNKFQSMVVWVCGIKFDDETVKFRVNEALKKMWHDGDANGFARGEKQKPDCLMCDLYRNAHPHDITAFEQRPPTTEGKLQSEGIRYRALRRRWLDHPGTLMKHDKQMREQSQRATDGPHTERVPKVPRLTVKLDPMPPT